MPRLNKINYIQILNENLNNNKSVLNTILDETSHGNLNIKSPTRSNTISNFNGFFDKFEIETRPNKELVTRSYLTSENKAYVDDVNQEIPRFIITSPSVNEMTEL